MAENKYLKDMKIGGVKATTFGNNLKKSALYTVEDVSKELIPFTYDLVGANTEIVSATKDVIKKLSPKAIKKKITESQEYKDLGKIKRNLKKDFRKGKFNNRSRSVSGGFDDFDFSDFDIDYDTDDDFSFSDNSVTNIFNGSVNGDSEISSSIKQSAASQIKFSAECSQQQMSITSAINDNVAKLLTFHKESTSKHYEETAKYYANMTQFQTEIRGIMERAFPKPAQEKPEKESDYERILGSGALDVTEYVKTIFKKNVPEMLSDLTGGMTEMLSIIDKDMKKQMWQEFVANPAGKIVSTLITESVPKYLKASINDLNKSFKDTLTTFAMQMNTFAKRDLLLTDTDEKLVTKIFKYGIGKILKIQHKNAPVRLRTDKYEKGAVAFDGVTRKAIIEVIPMYLSKILASIQGTKDEIIYDYEEGQAKWKSVKKKEFELQKYYNSSAEFFDIESKVTNFLKEKGGVQDVHFNDDYKKDLREIVSALKDKKLPHMNDKAEEELFAEDLVLRNPNNLQVILGALTGGALKSKEKLALAGTGFSIQENENRFMKEQQKNAEFTGMSQVLNDSKISKTNSNDYKKSIEESDEFTKIRLEKNFNSTSFKTINLLSDIKRILIEGIDVRIISKYGEGVSTERTDELNVLYKEKSKIEKQKEFLKSYNEEKRLRKEVQLEANIEEFTNSGKVGLGSYEVGDLYYDTVEDAARAMYDLRKKKDDEDESTVSKGPKIFAKLKDVFKNPARNAKKGIDGIIDKISDAFFGRVRNGNLDGEDEKDPKPFAKVLFEKMDAIGNKITELADGFKKFYEEKIKPKLFGKDGVFTKFSRTFFGEKNEDGKYENGIFSKYRNMVKDFSKHTLAMFTGNSYTLTDGSKIEERKEGSLSYYFKSLKNKFKLSLFGKDESNKKVQEGVFTKFTNETKHTLTKFKEELFGKSDKDKTKELKNKFKEYAPVGMYGGTLGLIGSIFLPGGPLLGMTIGSLASMSAKSGHLQTLLFGSESTNKEIFGKKFTGLFNTEIGKKIGGGLTSAKQNASGIVKGSSLGLLGSLFLPGGPLLGMTIGGFTGFAKQSGWLKKALFGEGEDADEKAKEFTQKFNAGMKKVGFGAVKYGSFGLLGSLFLPGGPIISPLLGMFIGNKVTQKNFKDKVNKFLFGDFDVATGKGRVGQLTMLTQVIKHQIAKPIKNAMMDFKDNLNFFFKKHVFIPLKYAFEPLKEFVSYQAKRFIKNPIKKFIIKPIVNTVSKILEPVRKAVNGVAKLIMFPFKFLGKSLVKLTVGSVVGLSKKAEKYLAKRGVNTDILGRRQRKADELSDLQRERELAKSNANLRKQRDKDQLKAFFALRDQDTSVYKAEKLWEKRKEEHGNTLTDENKQKINEVLKANGIKVKGDTDRDYQKAINKLKNSSRFTFGGKRASKLDNIANSMNEINSIMQDNREVRNEEWQQKYGDQTSDNMTDFFYKERRLNHLMAFEGKSREEAQAILDQEGRSEKIQKDIQKANDNIDENTKKTYEGINKIINILGGKFGSKSKSDESENDVPQIKIFKGKKATLRKEDEKGTNDQQPKKFATGGIVKKATQFGTYKNGQPMIAGEAGYEAIMPLDKLKDFVKEKKSEATEAVLNASEKLLEKLVNPIKKVTSVLLLPVTIVKKTVEGIANIPNKINEIKEGFKSFFDTSKKAFKVITTPFKFVKGALFGDKKAGKEGLFKKAVKKDFNFVNSVKEKTEAEKEKKFFKNGFKGLFKSSEETASTLKGTLGKKGIFKYAILAIPFIMKVFKGIKDFVEGGLFGFIKGSVKPGGFLNKAANRVVSKLLKGIAKIFLKSELNNSIRDIASSVLNRKKVKLKNVSSKAKRSGVKTLAKVKGVTSKALTRTKRTGAKALTKVKGSKIFGKISSNSLVKNATETLKRPNKVSKFAKKITKKAGGEAAEGVAKKGFISGFKKIVMSKPVKGVLGSKGAEALSKAGAKKLFGKVGKKIAIKAGSAVLAAPVTAAFVASDIVSGMTKNGASKIFKLPKGKKPNLRMRVSAAIGKAVSNNLLFGMLPESSVSKVIYDVIASDEEMAKLDAMQNETSAQSEKMGMTEEEYLKDSHKSIFSKTKDFLFGRKSTDATGITTQDQRGLLNPFSWFRKKSIETPKVQSGRGNGVGSVFGQAKVSPHIQNSFINNSNTDDVHIRNNKNLSPREISNRRFTLLLNSISKLTSETTRIANALYTSDLSMADLSNRAFEGIGHTVISTNKLLTPVPGYAGIQNYTPVQTPTQEVNKTKEKKVGKLKSLTGTIGKGALGGIAGAAAKTVGKGLLGIGKTFAFSNPLLATGLGSVVGGTVIGALRGFYKKGFDSTLGKMLKKVAVMPIKFMGNIAKSIDRGILKDKNITQNIVRPVLTYARNNKGWFLSDKEKRAWDLANKSGKIKKVTLKDTFTKNFTHEDLGDTLNQAKRNNSKYASGYKKIKDIGFRTKVKMKDLVGKNSADDYAKEIEKLKKNQLYKNSTGSADLKERINFFERKRDQKLAKNLGISVEELRLRNSVPKPSKLSAIKGKVSSTSGKAFSFLNNKTGGNLAKIGGKVTGKLGGALGKVGSVSGKLSGPMANILSTGMTAMGGPLAAAAPLVGAIAPALPFIAGGAAIVGVAKFGPQIAEFMENLPEKLAEFTKSAGKFVLKSIKNLPNTLLTLGKSLFKITKSAVTLVPKTILILSKDMFKSIGSGLKKVPELLWNGIKGLPKLIIKGVTAIPKKIISFTNKKITSLFKFIKEKIGGVITKPVKTVTNLVTKPVKYVKGLFGKKKEIQEVEPTVVTGQGRGNTVRSTVKKTIAGGLAATMLSSPLANVNNTINQTLKNPIIKSISDALYPLYGKAAPIIAPAILGLTLNANENILKILDTVKTQSVSSGSDITSNVAVKQLTIDNPSSLEGSSGGKTSKKKWYNPFTWFGKGNGRGERKNTNNVAKSYSGRGLNNGLPYFNQNDKRWKDVDLSASNDGDTIGSAGCGPAAVSMALASRGINSDPVSASEFAKSYKLPNQGVTADFVSDYASSNGVNLQGRYVDNYTTNDIDQSLAMGQPVVALGSSKSGNTPYTDSGHYITISGKDEKGNYRVSDPLNESNNKKSFKPSELLKNTDSYWTDSSVDGSQVDDSLFGLGDKDKPPQANGFAVWSQHDSRWSSKKYSGGNLSSAGCGPTSFAIALTNLKAKAITPDGLADKAISGNHVQVGVGTKWSFFPSVAPAYDAKSEQISKSSIEGALKDKKPVILSGQGSAPFTKGGHFVTAVGLKNGKYLINDPNDKSGEYSTSSINSKVAGAWKVEGADGSGMNHSKIEKFLGSKINLNSGSNDNDNDGDSGSTGGSNGANDKTPETGGIEGFLGALKDVFTGWITGNKKEEEPTTENDTGSGSGGGSGAGSDPTGLWGSKTTGKRGDGPLIEMGAYYETSGFDPGKISSGDGDAGGKSYGLPQFTYKLPGGKAGEGSLKNSYMPFLKKNSSKYPNVYKMLKDKTVYSAAFDAAWKDTAKKYKDEFASSQSDLAKAEYYDPHKAKLISKGYDVDKQPKAIHSIIFSRGMQIHNFTPGLFESGAKAAGMTLKESNNKPAELIKGIYKSLYDRTDGLFKDCASSIRNNLRARRFNMSHEDGEYKYASTIYQREKDGEIYRKSGRGVAKRVNNIPMPKPHFINKNVSVSGPNVSASLPNYMSETSNKINKALDMDYITKNLTISLEKVVDLLASIRNNTEETAINTKIIAEKEPRDNTTILNNIDESHPTVQMNSSTSNNISNNSDGDIFTGSSSLMDKDPFASLKTKVMKIATGR